MQREGNASIVRLWPFTLDPVRFGRAVADALPKERCRGGAVHATGGVVTRLAAWKYNALIPFERLRSVVRVLSSVAEYLSSDVGGGAARMRFNQ